MAVRTAIALGVAALAFCSAAARAGPCAGEIYDADIAINKRLDAAAAHGKALPQSSAATMHRQPTPRSVAGAEAKAGDISEADFKALNAFMQDARKADDTGDLAACHKALADLKRILER